MRGGRTDASRSRAPAGSSWAISCCPRTCSRSAWRWPSGASELAEADEVARARDPPDSGRRVLAAATPPPAFSEDFAAITQDHRLGRGMPKRKETRHERAGLFPAHRDPGQRRHGQDVPALQPVHRPAWRPACRPTQILATTFTRKAAGEIQDRVLLAAGGSGDRRAQRARSWPRRSATEAFTSRERRRAARRRRSARCIACASARSTATSCKSPADFGLELGLPPGWTICDELVDAGASRRGDRGDAGPRPAGRAADADQLCWPRARRCAASAAWSATRSRSSSSCTARPRRRLGADSAHARGSRRRSWTRCSSRSPALSDAGSAMDEGPRRRRGQCPAAATGTSFIARGWRPRCSIGETAYYKKPIPDELLALYQQLLAHAESRSWSASWPTRRGPRSSCWRDFAEQYAALQPSSGPCGSTM